MARGRILCSWTLPPVEEQKLSWEGRGAITAIPGTLTKRKTFSYTLSLPISTAIISCDSVEQVEECVELARSSKPLKSEADGRTGSKSTACCKAGPLLSADARVRSG